MALNSIKVVVEMFGGNYYKKFDIQNETEILHNIHDKNVNKIRVTVKDAVNEYTITNTKYFTKREFYIQYILMLLNDSPIAIKEIFFPVDKYILPDGFK